MHRRFRSLALTLGLLGLLVFAPAAPAAHRKAAPMPKLVKGTLLSLGDCTPWAGRSFPVRRRARPATVPPISWSRLLAPAAGI